MTTLKNHWHHPIYQICRIGVGLILRTFVRIRVEGRENIPLSGPVIIASNHIHNFDPPTIGIMIPRFVHFMAKSELYRIRIVGYLLRILGAFPVRRGGQDKSAIRTALSVPASGGCLLVFPEGHRSRTGQLGEGMPGVAFIARRSNCPIIPCAVRGQYHVGGKVIIRFGQPIAIELADTNESLIMRVMESIHNLSRDTVGRY